MINAAKKLNEPKITLFGLARVAMAQSGNNFDKAVEGLVNKLVNDPGLVRLVVIPAIQAIASQCIHRSIGERRAAIMHPFAPGEDVLKAKTEAAAVMLLDFPLGAGVLLRDARRDEVIKAADRYAEISKDTGHKGRWLRLVAQAVPANALVGSVVTEERVKELFEEARHG